MRIRKSDKPSVAALYARVSTPDQASTGYSLSAQIEDLRKHCRDRGIMIFNEYVEPGVSATDDHRRVFRRMMEEVLAPSSSVDTILVPTTSRFMRNVDKARFHKSLLKKRGIRVIATKQETSDDAPGHLAEGMFELFDQYESEINGMRTAAGLREAARQGFFPSPHPPFGFRRERVDGVLKRHRLVPNPDEVAQHREVFRSYVHVGGSKSAAQDLNRRELRYRDGRRFTKDTVLRIIDEHAAIGTYFWNRYDSKSGVELPEEEWIAIPCEPILDRELWDLAQKVRNERDPKRSSGRTGSSPLLLAGLIFCGKCSASYQLETSGKAPPIGGREYRYYNCRSFVRTGRDKCAGSRIPTAELDKAVIEHLADRLFTEERCELILKDILQESGLLRRKANEQLQLMNTELEDVTKKLRRWEEAFENGALPADLGLERLAELRARREELRQALANVVPIQPPPAHIFAAANVQRFREHIRGIFLGGDNALAKHYLRHIVARIEVTDAHVRVFGKTEAVAELLAERNNAPRAMLTAGGEVLASVGTWLRRRVSNPRPGG